MVATDEFSLVDLAVPFLFRMGTVVAGSYLLQRLFSTRSRILYSTFPVWIRRVLDHSDGVVL